MPRMLEPINKSVALLISPLHYYVDSITLLLGLEIMYLDGLFYWVFVQKKIDLHRLTS